MCTIIFDVQKNNHTFVIIQFILLAIIQFILLASMIKIPLYALNIVIKYKCVLLVPVNSHSKKYLVFMAGKCDSGHVFAPRPHD